MDWTLGLFALVLCLSYGVQTITGFGSMLLAVTLGAQLMPIDRVLTLALPLSLLQTTYIVLRHWRSIQWRLLLARILPAMGLGMLVGFWVAAHAPDAGLKRALGALVFALAARELWRLVPRRGGVVQPRKLPAALVWGVMWMAGVIHGVFATGGPLLVYVTSRIGLDKHAFRATLTGVWLVLNSVLIARFAAAGRFNWEIGESVLWLAPAILVGIFLGEKLHKRVNEERFRMAVYTLLLAASLVLLLR